MPRRGALYSKYCTQDSALAYCIHLYMCDRPLGACGDSVPTPNWAKLPTPGWSPSVRLACNLASLSSWPYFSLLHPYLYSIPFASGSQNSTSTTPLLWNTEPTALYLNGEGSQFSEEHGLGTSDSSKRRPFPFRNPRIRCHVPMYMDYVCGACCRVRCPCSQSLAGCAGWMPAQLSRCLQIRHDKSIFIFGRPRPEELGFGEPQHAPSRIPNAILMVGTYGRR
ncbi:hypothetical protein LXA43DRAFT_308855 [Ganoderma leucocontextum]|nr:hypothetical protein LXA43DRAFT_308855 [Ganoderma leucocontextum]